MDRVCLVMLAPTFRHLTSHIDTWFQQVVSPEVRAILTHQRQKRLVAPTGMHVYFYPFTAKDRHNVLLRYAFMWKVASRSKRPLFLKMDTDTMIFPTALARLVV